MLIKKIITQEGIISISHNKSLLKYPSSSFLKLWQMKKCTFVVCPQL